MLSASLSSSPCFSISQTARKNSEEHQRISNQDELIPQKNEEYGKLSTFPKELIIYLMHYLSAGELSVTSKVNRSFRNLIIEALKPNQISFKDWAIFFQQICQREKPFSYRVHDILFRHLYAPPWQSITLNSITLDSIKTISDIEYIIFDFFDFNFDIGLDESYKKYDSQLKRLVSLLPKESTALNDHIIDKLDLYKIYVLLLHHYEDIISSLARGRDLHLPNLAILVKDSYDNFSSKLLGDAELLQLLINSKLIKINFQTILQNIYSQISIFSKNSTEEIALAFKVEQALAAFQEANPLISDLQALDLQGSKTKEWQAIKILSELLGSVKIAFFCEKESIRTFLNSESQFDLNFETLCLLKNLSEDYFKTNTGSAPYGIVKAVIEHDTRALEQMKKIRFFKEVRDPLSYAIQFLKLNNIPQPEKLRVMRELLDLGVRINQRSDFGRTPMHEAAQYQDSDAIRFLRNNGAFLNTIDKAGIAPLHLAANHRGGHRGEPVRALIELGVNINIQDEKGMAPLHYAAIYLDINSVLALMELGADSEIKNKKNQTPIEMLREVEMDNDICDIAERNDIIEIINLKGMVGSAKKYPTILV